MTPCFLDIDDFKNTVYCFNNLTNLSFILLFYQKQIARLFKNKHRWCQAIRATDLELPSAGVLKGKQYTLLFTLLSYLALTLPYTSPSSHSYINVFFAKSCTVTRGFLKIKSWLVSESRAKHRDRTCFIGLCLDEFPAISFHVFQVSNSKALNVL